MYLSAYGSPSLPQYHTNILAVERQQLLDGKQELTDNSIKLVQQKTANLQNLADLYQEVYDIKKAQALNTALKVIISPLKGGFGGFVKEGVIQIIENGVPLLLDKFESTKLTLAYDAMKARYSQLEGDYLAGSLSAFKALAEAAIVYCEERDKAYENAQQNNQLQKIRIQQALAEIPDPPLIDNRYFLALGQNLSERWHEFSSKTDDFLSADDLETMLSGMDGVNKWIIVDACNSGYLSTATDNLSKSLLLDSSKIGTYSAYDEKGEGIFTQILLSGLTKDADGFFKADKDKKNGVSTDELYDYLTINPDLSNWYGDVVYEKDLGASVIFTGDLWNPEKHGSLDFDGFLTANQVPLPWSIWMFGSGLLGLVGWRRYRKG